MNTRNFSFFLITLYVTICFSCKKTEFEDVLKKHYETSTESAEFIKDFTVQLHARALQPNESGKWKLISGEVKESFVYFEDEKNPFTNFIGIPGETYRLEWSVIGGVKTNNTTTVDVTIPTLNVVIQESTPSNFQTIKYLEVDPKYKGKWSFDKPYGHIWSGYHDGVSEPSENKPSIELHGFSHTTYTAKYTVNYADKEFVFTKQITTGEYQEDEALDELQLRAGNSRVVKDDQGRVLELNLQANDRAWILEHENEYPSIRALKYLRKLILGGSSVGQIPTVFGDYYHDLEVLDMDPIGEFLVIPENIGNLKKLKTLILSPARVLENYTLKLPPSFAQLESLEYFSIRYVGMVDFNGTLGGLTKLKHLSSMVTEIPDNIGNLKNLEYISLISTKSYIPEELTSCTNINFLRLIFQDQDIKRIDLPSKIDNLKKLKHFELITNHLYSLPESFGDLPSLNFLSIESANLGAVPASFGNLSQLESLTLSGNYTVLPEEFGNLKNLKYLVLTATLKKLPEGIGGLAALEFLNLSHSTMTTLPSSFGDLKKLKELNASFSQLNKLPVSFSNLDKLEKVDFGYTKFDSFPEEVIGLKSINTIILNGTKIRKIPTSIYNIQHGVFIDLYLSAVDLDDLRELVKVKFGVVFRTDSGYIYSMQ